MDRHLLSVRGIAARGRHGANPGERDEPQRFTIDVEVEVEVASDALEGTVDYRALADDARKTVETTSFILLESLAQAVADGISGKPGVATVRVTIHKPAAAASVGADDVSATAVGRGNRNPQGL